MQSPALMSKRPFILSLGTSWRDWTGEWMTTTHPAAAVRSKSLNPVQRRAFSDVHCCRRSLLFGTSLWLAPVPRHLVRGRFSWTSRWKDAPRRDFFSIFCRETVAETWIEIRIVFHCEDKQLLLYVRLNWLLLLPFFCALFSTLYCCQLPADETY